MCRGIGEAAQEGGGITQGVLQVSMSKVSSKQGVRRASVRT